MKTVEKIRKIPKEVRASAALFISGVLTKGIAYITTPLYTRLMPSAIYGQVSVFNTWLEVFGIVAMFCLASGVFNTGMVDFPNKRAEYSLSMLALSNIITLAFSLLLLILYPYVKNIIGLDYKFVLLMCVIYFFQPAYNFWVAKQRYELKSTFVVIWSICLAILSPLAALCCLYYGDNPLYDRIFGAETVLIIAYVCFYIYTIYKAKCKIDVSYWKGALLFNIPLIPHYLSMYLLASSDKIMISALVGSSKVAYYSVAYSVAAVVLIVWSAINASLVPYTFEKCRVGDYKSVSKAATPMMLIFVVACCSIILFAPEVVRIMATEEYLDCVYVIPPIVGGVFFQVQYYFYANIVFYHKKPVVVMIGSVTATVLNLILNFIFIPKYGYYAAGYTTLFCYMIQALIDYFAMKKVVGNSVYDMKKVTVMSVAMILFSTLSVYLYNSAVIRYCMVTVIILALFICRKRVLNIFKLKN